MSAHLAHVDAFTNSTFKRNPTVVCLLEEDKDDAYEFNISQTCYLTRIDDQPDSNPSFRLRWFTSVAEICFVFINGR
ncbi:hypothetical protein Ddye_024682 [Dipteronia dyeriana]|uniref:Uncharacterized protein n=1 Tax=Dipteronia dyeriana TaxID=168575 RepID=A0AAD9TWB0_9ROSI|nr:hypothetical protein Ddye_024682 [Dipteronia dyeriana]